MSDPKVGGKTQDELQAELDLLREQEAALAAKEAEIEAEAEQEPQPVPALVEAVKAYREHGRMGSDSGDRV